MLLQVILAGFKISDLEMNSVRSIYSLDTCCPRSTSNPRSPSSCASLRQGFPSPTLAMKPCSWCCCWPKKLHMGVETAEFLVEVLVELLKSLEDNDQTSTFKVCWKTWRRAGRRCTRTGWPWSGGRGKERDILYLPGVESPSDKQLEATRPCPPASWYRPWPPGLSWTCRPLKA